MVGVDINLFVRKGGASQKKIGKHCFRVRQTRSWEGANRNIPLSHNIKVALRTKANALLVNLFHLTPCSCSNYIFVFLEGNEEYLQLHFGFIILLLSAIARKSIFFTKRVALLYWQK